MLTAYASFPVGDLTGWIIDGVAVNAVEPIRHIPPSVVTEAIDKPECGICWGTGRMGLPPRFGDDTCSHCAGSGRAVIELTVPCRHDWRAHSDPEGPDCDGSITVRVIPEQAGPIVAPDDPNFDRPFEMVVSSDGRAWIDGVCVLSDAARYVGRFVVIGKEVET